MSDIHPTAEIARACEYNDGAGFPDEGRESDVDSLIEYKNALEDRLCAVLECTDDIREALEGDSNDAEHDALAAVAEALQIPWTSFYDKAENQ